MRTIAAYSYRKSHGLPLIYPKQAYKYTANFLHMLFSMPYEDYELKPEVVQGAGFDFPAARGPRAELFDLDRAHGGVEPGESVCQLRRRACARCGGRCTAARTRRCIEMLEQIHQEGDDGSKFIAAAKDKNSGKKLMGFGHRVYKNYDPRAKIIKKACDDVLAKLHIDDPLLDIAKKLEEAALQDSYFVERKLYPNVDFYSGIIMRAIGIPVEMFTGDFRHRPDARLDCELQGNHGGAEEPHLPAAPDLRRPARAALRAHREENQARLT